MKKGTAADQARARDERAHARRPEPQPMSIDSDTDTDEPETAEAPFKSQSLQPSCRFTTYDEALEHCRGCRPDFEFSSFRQRKRGTTLENTLRCIHETCPVERYIIHNSACRKSVKKQYVVYEVGSHGEHPVTTRSHYPYTNEQRVYMEDQYEADNTITASKLRGKMIEAKLLR